MFSKYYKYHNDQKSFQSFFEYIFISLIHYDIYFLAQIYFNITSLLNLNV
jgi:hypothetical protein